jgi:arsenite methyltransferase
MSALGRLGISAQRPAPDGDASRTQAQTEQAFGFKWARRDTYESPAMQEQARRWLFERYCGGDSTVLDGWLAGSRKVIVDAGCGAGFSALLFFGERLREHDYLGVDISAAVDVARERFAEADVPGDFLRSDLLAAPIPDASVDLLFSEGVLHHTDSTEAALKHLARKLRPGGRFLFYVYAKKAVIREFTDDHIREHLRTLSDEEAWRALEPLTRLGAALGELNAEIDVPEAIPYLGIPAGRLDIQRFFYWNVCKLFYRPEFTFDEMNHVNFDWFRPLNCHRQSPEEVRRWCSESALEIERLDVQEAGITGVARRV